MATRFLSIRSLQSEPFERPPDKAGRARFTFNVLAHKVTSETFLRELVAILQDATIGTFATDLFITMQAEIPTGDGPYLHIIDTGGPTGLRTQDSEGIRYSRPTASVTAIGKDAEAARAKAMAALSELDSVTNRDVTAA